MGWYGDLDVKCPNCGEDKAVIAYRNSMTTDLYLACPNCGLCAYFPKREWVVNNSYLDNSIIGKDPEDIAPEEFIDIEKNQDIIKRGSTL
jgi:transcription elongation factor Elf1